MMSNDRIRAHAEAKAGTKAPRAAARFGPYLDDYTDVPRLMSEFLSAKDDRAIRQKVEDWVARGQPCADLGDFLIAGFAHTIQYLDRMRLTRREYLRKHIEESAERQWAEADRLGGLLRLNPYLPAPSLRVAQVRGEAVETAIRPSSTRPTARRGS